MIVVTHICWYNDQMILHRTLRPGQIIFYQGEAALKTYRIDAGLVRAYLIHDNGDEATVAYFGPGDIFPIAPSFDITPVTLFYYETTVETDVSVMNKHDFEDYLANHTTEELHRSATRYVSATLHISALMQTTARAKLAHTMRHLAIRFGEKNIDGSRRKIPIKLTQQDLARLCGASRETMSIELGRLKDEGVVMVKEKQYIVHLAKINEIISDESTTDINLS